MKHVHLKKIGGAIIVGALALCLVSPAHAEEKKSGYWASYFSFGQKEAIEKVAEKEVKGDMKDTEKGSSSRWKAVIGSKIIKNDSLQGKDIKNDTIESEDIKDEEVKSEDIRNGEVKNEDLADNSITSGKISNGTIITEDLADSAVTSAKILNSTVATEDLADSAVSSAKISNGTVATEDLADNAVTSAKINDGTIVNADVSGSAAIAYSKLNLTSNITNADVSNSAAINSTKINFTNNSVNLGTGNLTANQVNTPTLVVTSSATIGNTLAMANLSSDPVTCDGTTEGLIYYNSADHQLKVCNGTAWTNAL